MTDLKKNDREEIISMLLNLKSTGFKIIFYGFYCAI